MSGQDWSIKIIPMPGGGAAFQPDIAGSQPGDPLQAEASDLISWNNRTSEEHQPWPTDNLYEPLPDQDVTRGGSNYLSDPIPPWEPSTPAFTTPINATQTIIYYCCKIHPKEHGEIVVKGTA